MNVIKIFLLMSSLTYQIFGSDQICPSPLPEEYNHVQAGSIVSAYFGNWDVYGANAYHIDKIADIADKLTHLTYGFMKPDHVQGVCKPHDIWADVGAYEGLQTNIGGNFAKMLELKKKFPHLKILLSIGGGTYNKNFLALAQDKKKLFAFAKSCIDLLDFYDHPYINQDGIKLVNHLTYDGLFDGIDLDWEWNQAALTPALSLMYTQFVQELRRLLQIRSKKTGVKSLLTLALQVTPKIYNTLDLALIAQSVDWFNVMAYDFYGANNERIGFNAPLCGTYSVYSIDGAIQRIMKRGVSPDKMVLGLPLYGYVYENTDGYNALIDKKNKVKTLAYHTIKSKYIHNVLYEKEWNQYEKIPSLYSKKNRTFITYDGPESIASKIEFAQTKRLHGVVLWRLSGDDAEHSMVKIIAHAMHKA